MILKPGSVPNSKILLDAASELLDREYPGLKPSLDRVGTRYQLATTYLLLRAARSEAIQEALSKYDLAVYEDIQPVILYEMRVRLCGKRGGGGPIADMLDAYTETGGITAKLLEAYATVVKSNVEVKMLMALFGYRQVVFPGSEDGTGALPMVAVTGGRGAKERLKPKGSSTGEAFLTDHFDRCGILVLKDAHWSAVKSLFIEDGHVWALFFLDPGLPRNKEFRLDPWDSRARLYFFKREPGLEKTMAGLVHGLLEGHEAVVNGGTTPAAKEKKEDRDLKGD
ncbi:MAG: hypothetical protein JW839_21940 [Candidatus Lokiarchaeota archaeon]|nr:hypothetical protein [Candidatus Lokiarchaeota archaeon]